MSEFETDKDIAEAMDWSGDGPGEIGDLLQRWTPSTDGPYTHTYVPCDHDEVHTIEGEWLVTRCRRCPNEATLHRAVYNNWPRLGPGWCRSDAPPQGEGDR